jgi:hypothetical protein
LPFLGHMRFLQEIVLASYDLLGGQVTCHIRGHVSWVTSSSLKLSDGAPRPGKRRACFWS